MKFTASVLCLALAGGLSSGDITAAASKKVTVTITGHVLSGTNGAGTKTPGPFGMPDAPLAGLPYVLTLSFPFDPVTVSECSGGVNSYYSDTQTPGIATLKINGHRFTFNKVAYDATSISFNAQLNAIVPKCYPYSMARFNVTVSYGQIGSEYKGSSYIAATVTPLTESNPLTSDDDWDPPVPNPNKYLNPKPAMDFVININASTADGGAHAYGQLTPESFMVTSY